MSARTPTAPSPSYEPPRLTAIGTLHELTLVDPCNKDLGGSDGFTYQQQPVVCTSR